ncbi:glutamyl-tRNA synthetase, putative [Theileria annulata]|uniref:Glutamyl-tRNA synthetase, putative n=1 Tax=Theileria annulata TaxID=5874 RepID=Q4UHR6_THEAN|nr:glutamyl-tRNA synthetase, putative [Theileria annulata]CAI73373.1 glutamyl-tRNA synthetase, putative [Theileria annulata]|eukprot:XP_954050.1 glutamyl-tRNA synthetase, putative [Theileria annulata]
MCICSTLWTIYNVLHIFLFWTSCTLSYRLNNIKFNNVNGTKTFFNPSLIDRKNISYTSNFQLFDVLNHPAHENNNYLQHNENRLTYDDVLNDLKTQEVRVRFAPSPTGPLHIGSLRTYIYNYIFAKKNKGKLILRIDDTDSSRNNQDSLKDIFSSLNWIGLVWDEGVHRLNGDMYYQSNRKEIYKKFAQKLIDNNKAYYCFCRENIFTKFLSKIFKIKFNYKCKKCPKLSQNEIKTKLKNLKFIILLRSEGDDFDDFILVRRNGVSTYNFSSSVDDVLMNVTHIIRGSEHTNNLHKQEYLFNLLDYKCPKFVHLPLLHDEQKTKLSKRNPNSKDYTVKNLRLNGICRLPLINYLTFLGTRFISSNEIYEVADIIKMFSFDLLNNEPAVFDYKKLLHLNRKYINNLSIEEFKSEILSFQQFYNENKETEEDEMNTSLIMDQLLEIYQKRLVTLRDYFNLVNSALGYNYENLTKNKDEELDSGFKEWLKFELNLIFEKSKNSVDLHANFANLVNEAMVSGKKNLKHLRFLLTGEEVGPSLIDLV